jgi:hypothetical protein
MTEVAFSTSVTGLATVIAGLRAKGCALLQGSWWWEVQVSEGGRTECVGERSVSSAMVRSEWGDVWRQDGRPHLRGG